MERRTAARIAAPAAFLLAVTIAVLLVRAGLQESDGSGPPPAAVTTGGQLRVVIVRRGDTLEVIAARTGTTVARLRRLNPGLDPVALRPGLRLRVQ